MLLCSAIGSWQPAGVGILAASGSQTGANSGVGVKGTRVSVGGGKRVAVSARLGVGTGVSVSTIGTCVDSILQARLMTINNKPVRIFGYGDLLIPMLLLIFDQSLT